MKFETHANLEIKNFKGLKSNKERWPWNKKRCNLISQNCEFNADKRVINSRMYVLALVQLERDSFLFQVLNINEHHVHVVDFFGRFLVEGQKYKIKVLFLNDFCRKFKFKFFIIFWFLNLFFFSIFFCYFLHFFLMIWEFYDLHPHVNLILTFLLFEWKICHKIIQMY